MLTEFPVGLSRRIPTLTCKEIRKITTFSPLSEELVARCRETSKNLLTPKLTQFLRAGVFLVYKINIISLTGFV